MKIVAVVEARMRSSRLPGKVLMPLLGKPMLEVLVERAMRASRLSEVVIATTDDPSSDPIAALMARLRVPCFRGSELDVLDRVLGAARSRHADLIVSLTGDNPLVDPDMIDDAIAAYVEGEVDYVSTSLEPGFPRGTRVQVYSTALLSEVDQLAREQPHREHVTLYIYERRGRYRLRHVESDLPAGARELRLTVDTPEDFEVVKRTYEALYPTCPAFGIGDVVRFLQEHPEVRALNADVQQRTVPRTSGT